MKIIVNLLTVVCAINTFVLTYLTYCYFRSKNNTLEDDGATDTEQEN